jgi:putative membrane protein
MTRVDVGEHLALLNAILNGTSAVLLVAGRFAIANKRVLLHRRIMLTAFATSTVFLISYLTRVALTGTHADPHHGAVHAVYYAVLFTHMILAITVVPLVLIALWHAWHARFEKHKKIARVTFPIWLYVSVTGVVVYVMLYQVPV